MESVLCSYVRTQDVLTASKAGVGALVEEQSILQVACSGDVVGIAVWAG